MCPEKSLYSWLSLPFAQRRLPRAVHKNVTWVWPASPSTTGLEAKDAWLFIYLLIYSLFRQVVSRPGWPPTCCVVEDGLELLILLPHSLSIRSIGVHHQSGL